mgnify:CR=1 FL=1
MTNPILGGIANFPKDPADKPKFVLELMKELDAKEVMSTCFGPLPVVTAVGAKATKEFLSSSKHSEKGQVFIFFLFESLFIYLFYLFIY